jgi:hypothetical protein
VRPTETTGTVPAIMIFPLVKEIKYYISTYTEPPMLVHKITSHTVTKIYMYAGLLLLLNRAAFSNDCAVIFGRNDEVTGVHATNISLREEEITITLRKNYYEVNVTFDFFNGGTTEKILLGFPVESSMYKSSDNDVYDFKTVINGKIIPVNTTKTDSIRSEGGYNDYVKWFIRNAVFPAGSRTVSNVTYKARYGYCGGLTTAGYIYGTGRFWKDGIGKMTLIINHGDDMLVDKVGFPYANDIFSNDTVNAEASKFIWEADGRYKYIFKNVKPPISKAKVVIFVQPFDIYGEYNNEFGVTPRNMKGSHINNYHYDYWWAWDEHLLYRNPTDIQHYTRNQIRLFINFFFALRGYDFKNPLYKEYFGRIDGFGDKNNTTYTVNPTFDGNTFNEIERKNVDYLLKLEKIIPSSEGTVHDR